MSLKPVARAGMALYLSDGKLYACGANSSGELGDGTMISSANPMPVVGLPDESIRSIGSSWENSGAVMADGSYFDWGYNHADQLGNGTTVNSDIPVRVRLPAKIQQLSLGGSAPGNGQTVAILANGSLWAWGQNQYGQLGNGDVSSSSGPIEVDVPPATILCPGHLWRSDRVWDSYFGCGLGLGTEQRWPVRVRRPDDERPADQSWHHVELHLLHCGQRGGIELAGREVGPL